MALQIELGCAVLLMGLPLTTEAAPVYWESDFGPALFALTREDRAVENVSLSFVFPMAGTDYSSVYASTDGYLNLRDPAGYAFANPLASDLLNSTVPLIAPFFADLDLLVHGRAFQGHSATGPCSPGTRSVPGCRPPHNSRFKSPSFRAASSDFPITESRIHGCISTPTC